MKLTYPIVEFDYLLKTPTLGEVSGMNENITVRNVKFNERRQRMRVTHAHYPELKKFAKA